MKIQIGLAGLPYEVELRYWLACKLLLSSPTPMQLRKWDGKHCDVLVCDLDNEQGKLAYELAARSDMRVLFLSKSQHAAPLTGTHVDRHATPSAIAKALECVVQSMRVNAQDLVTGLLGIALLQGGNDHEVLARNGNVSVVLRHNSRHIYAGSREELEVAKQQLLDATWSCVTITAPYEKHYEGLMCESLDSFFISACHRHRSRLAPIGNTTYRLGIWPDLIAFAENREALRLSSALHRKGWRVRDLAVHCGVSTEEANAFCWAMQASGALKLEDCGPGAAVLEPANEAQAIPLTRQMALHFAQKTRQSLA